MTRRTEIYALLVMVASFVYFASINVSSTPVLLDEFAHVPAGISHWELGRFTLYRETPPFVQSLISLPVWLSGPKTDYTRAGAWHRSEWDVGRDFIELNKGNCQGLFRRARIVVVAFAVACGTLIFWWSREWAGTLPAVVAAGLWFSDPSVLANSTVATTDVGACAVGAYACYAFYQFLCKPSRAWALAAGIGLGLALVSKFSMLVLYPAWLLLAVVHRRLQLSAESEGAWDGTGFYTKLVLIGVTSVMLINTTYRFEGSFAPLGSFGFRSFALGGQRVRESSGPASGNRFAGTPLATLPVPLPSDYVLGLDSQKWEEEIGLKNLEEGRLVSGGFWYSPLRTLLYKLPMGMLLYLLFSVAVVLRSAVSAKDRCPSFEGVMPWGLALSILILLCTQTGLNWPVRYALPAFPFLFIAIARCLRKLCDRRALSYALLIPLLLNYTDTLTYHKSPRCYGNVLAGGPEGAQRIFMGSNFDWGQDLYNLSQWWKDRPESLPLAVSYYGVLPPQAVGLPQRGLPLDFWFAEGHDREAGRAEPYEFFWAISSNYLHGLTCLVSFEGGQTIYGSIHSPQLVPERAFAHIGYSLYIFRICNSRCQRHDRGHISGRSLSGCITEYREPEDGEINATP